MLGEDAQHAAKAHRAAGVAGTDHPVAVTYRQGQTVAGIETVVGRLGALRRSQRGQQLRSDKYLSINLPFA